MGEGRDALHVFPSLMDRISLGILLIVTLTLIWNLCNNDDNNSHNIIFTGFIIWNMKNISQYVHHNYTVLIINAIILICPYASPRHFTCLPAPHLPTATPLTGMTGPRGRKGADGLPGSPGSPGVNTWRVNSTAVTQLLIPPSIPGRNSITHP